MMKALVQAIAILTVSAIAAAATWRIVGPPEVGCDPVSIKPGEICIQSIPEQQEVLWIDARSRQDWERNGLPGSILWNNDPQEDEMTMESDAVERIFVTPFVIVYCADKGCGTSSIIAERIRKLDLEAEVYVLHEGWRALRDAGMVKSADD